MKQTERTVDHLYTAIFLCFELSADGFSFESSSWEKSLTSMTDFKRLEIRLNLCVSSYSLSSFQVAHDWGGLVAWVFTETYPELVTKLIQLNIPHPTVFGKALRGGNLRQILRSWYMCEPCASASDTRTL